MLDILGAHRLSTGFSLSGPADCGGDSFLSRVLSFGRSRVEGVLLTVLTLA